MSYFRRAKHRMRPGKLSVADLDLLAAADSLDRAYEHLGQSLERSIGVLQGCLDVLDKPEGRG
jgi:hypothetical protein